MSRLKDLIREAPVHERRLTFKTYPLENDQVIVEGWLRDERLVTGFHWNGQSRPQGVVHWMCVRLLVGEWPLSILDAEAEMPGVPHELCPTTLESVKKIINIDIVSGYSDEIKKRLGGVKGCAHLTHLILAMGPAALHGYWAQRSRKKRPVPRSMEEISGLSLLINSCRLWREDGPMMQMIRETMEEKHLAP
ncbi:MAG: DUF2889 domain-containing protein [Desulfobacterales bacterium]|nr:DUF2889 domain-containing protein [Desulfobacterales bacterium]